MIEVIDTVMVRRYHVNGVGIVGQVLRRRKPTGKKRRKLRGRVSVYRRIR